MGHCISVFVIKKDQANVDLSKLVHVEASQGFIILPDNQLWREEDKAEDVARRLSSGMVGYLTTDYFGGAGEQSASFFNFAENKGTYEAHFSVDSSINKVLAMMGLIRGAQFDEFDTLGLGGYRSNEDFNPEKEKEDEERYQAYFSAARKKSSFTRKEMHEFSEWCHQCYNYKGKDEWTHGSGGNEKNYSTDDLLTIYVSQQPGYTPE